MTTLRTAGTTRLESRAASHELVKHTMLRVCFWPFNSAPQARSTNFCHSIQYWGQTQTLRQHIRTEVVFHRIQFCRGRHIGTGDCHNLTWPFSVAFSAFKRLLSRSYHSISFCCAIFFPWRFFSFSFIWSLVLSASFICSFNLSSYFAPAKASPSFNPACLTAINDIVIMAKYPCNLFCSCSCFCFCALCAAINRWTGAWKERPPQQSSCFWPDRWVCGSLHLPRSWISWILRKFVRTSVASLAWSAPAPHSSYCWSHPRGHSS